MGMNGYRLPAASTTKRASGCFEGGAARGVSIISNAVFTRTRRVYVVLLRRFLVGHLVPASS